MLGLQFVEPRPLCTPPVQRHANGRQPFGKARRFLTVALPFLCLPGGTLRVMSRPRSTGNGIVIVGGGLAGQRCAETLRRSGYAGRIRIVCAERHRPYDRPPLSKEALAQSLPGGSGPATEDALAFRPCRWYEREAVHLLLGVRAVGLRPAERVVLLSDARRLRYTHLLIATGSRPRTLPLFERFSNVSAFRTLDDCWRLSEVISSRPTLAVIGAGFIGQEVAATARSLGCEVALVDAAPAPLAGVLGAELGAWFARLHRDHGVEVLADCIVERASGNGAVDELRLSDGRVLRPDHLVVGAGVRPECEWLADSGLEVGGGVRVDSNGRTRCRNVFAVGDAAATLDRCSGRYLAGSHWEAAGRQGARAARMMLGLDPGPVPVPSFWTDQYGIRIQCLGEPRCAEAIEFDGDPDSRSFTATFSRGGRTVGALLVNRQRSLPAMRQLIQKGAT
jgi:NADPH-dependent 2,4-dienoyl-CoA reductase/sulfur reductase-like enzyme